MFLGTKDKLIPVATAKKYRLLMKEAGVRSELLLYKEQAHGFFNTSKYDETVKEMDRFLVSLGFLAENLKD